jgi:hypothetical protein
MARTVAIATRRRSRDVLPDGGHEELVVGILEDEPDTRAQLAHRVVRDFRACDLSRRCADAVSPASSSCASRIAARRA